jgi:hypothetical protein
MGFAGGGERQPIDHDGMNGAGAQQLEQR